MKAWSSCSRPDARRSAATPSSIFSAAQSIYQGNDDVNDVAEKDDGFGQ